MNTATTITVTVMGKRPKIMGSTMDAVEMVPMGGGLVESAAVCMKGRKARSGSSKFSLIADK